MPGIVWAGGQERLAVDMGKGRRGVCIGASSGIGISTSEWVGMSFYPARSIAGPALPGGRRGRLFPPAQRLPVELQEIERKYSC